VNAVIFALGTVYVLVGLLLFAMLRGHHEFLRKRGYFGQVLCGASTLLQLIVIALREAIGRTNFSCDWYMVLSLLAVPLFAGPSLGRLANFSLMLRKAKQQAKFDDEMIVKVDPTLFASSRRALRAALGGSVVAAPGDAGGASSRRMMVQAAARSINPAPVLKAGLVQLREALVHASSRKPVVEPAPAEETNLARLIRARLLTSVTAEFIVFFIVSLPFFISIAIIFSVNPFYGRGCVGCTLYKSEEYLFIGQFVVIASITLALWYPVRHADDPLLIVWEVKWTGIFAGTGAIVGFVVDTFDPYHLAASGVMTWGWIVLAGMFAAFFMVTYWPMYHARKMSMQFETGVGSTSGESLDTVLADPLLKSAFAVHLVHEFAIESLRFWETASTWKNTYEANALRRDAMAEVIYETFVAPGSTMEINISYAQRGKTEANLDKETIMPDCFDDALAEVYALMARDSFPRFVKSEAYRELRATTKSRKSTGFAGFLKLTASNPMRDSP